MCSYRPPKGSPCSTPKGRRCGCRNGCDAHSWAQIHAKKDLLGCVGLAVDLELDVLVAHGLEQGKACEGVWKTA